jgi:hypothetical protein
MPTTRRTALLALTAGAALFAPIGTARAEPLLLARKPLAPTVAGTAKQVWVSGVSDPDPEQFGSWRGSTAGIAGMFGDASLAAQLEQYQFANSSFTGDVDLAVGGPTDHTWAEVAAGADVERWKQTAGVLSDNWHYRTVYLRYAHEMNGTWMPWSVAVGETTAFRTAFRLFVATMRSCLRGKDVRFVFAPNFGTWRYTPDTIWPGNDVVDIVGVSSYEWTPYNTAARWTAFRKSSIGPDYWLAYAKRHGKPMAFSEWGAESAYFVKAMHDWMSAHAGSGAGQLHYDVYFNANELVLTGSTAAAYSALRWGR